MGEQINVSSKEKRIAELLLKLHTANQNIESLKADLHTEKNNTFAQKLKVTNGNKLITEMMEWIDNKYEYYDNRHGDVEYAIFLILEEFKEQFEQKAKDIKDR